MKHVIKQNHPNRRVKDISVILLSAGIEDRAKGQGTPCLFDVGSVSMLDYQIDTLNKIFEKCEIIPVIGFQSSKILKRLHNKVGVVENQMFHDTNCVESLRLGINSTVSDNILIIHGNTAFNQNIFVNHSFSRSFIIYDDDDNMKESGVGIISNSGILSNMYYGLDSKWCNILYTTGKSTKALRSLVNKEKCSKKVMYEVINDLIKLTKIHTCKNVGKNILEVNNYREQIREVHNIIQGR
jgi:hypothetical protein